MKAMTKEEFKARWESDDDGGGISFLSIADCAVAWGISARPMTSRIDVIRYQVLKAAGVADAEDYKPDDWPTNRELLIEKLDREALEEKIQARRDADY